MNIDPRQANNLQQHGNKVVTKDGYVYDPNVLIEQPSSTALDSTVPLQEMAVAMKRGVAGFVNARVMGPPAGMPKEEYLKLLKSDSTEDWSQVSETGWKRNKILDVGLDKVANMPWAQVFQFCVAGTTRDTTPVAVTETGLKEYHSINSFWLIEEPHTSTTIGGDLGGNVVKLRRTFDFYKVFCPTIITEIGFKESPASRELFSRILLDPPQQLHAGQFLRIEYLLQIVMQPWSNTLSGARFGNLYDTGGGNYEIHDYSEGAPYVGNLKSYAWPASAHGTPTISGWTTTPDDLHGLQLVGMAGIDPQDGVVKPIDKSGFCNEPFAPGTCSFGPGYGYVNRWRNGSSVNYFVNLGKGVSLRTGQPHTSGDNPYMDIGPLYDYVDTHWVPSISAWMPDQTTQAKVYRNPHEWLNYQLAVSNDNRLDRDSNVAKGGLYIRTDGATDFDKTTYDTFIHGNTPDHRKYLYFNYWAPGILDNMGEHHGYMNRSGPKTGPGSVQGDANNAFDEVQGWDKEWQIRYWKNPTRDFFGVVADTRPDTEASAYPNGATINDRKDHAGEGNDVNGWKTPSIYKNAMGMTGSSSFENLTHLWDSLVKFNIGRGSWPTQVYTHYTNQYWDDEFAYYTQRCYPRGGAFPGTPDRSCGGNPVASYGGMEAWNASLKDASAGDVNSPDLSFYHAHYKGFWDPALGMPTINKYQCGSGRVYLSGHWHTYCPGTPFVVGHGQTATMPSDWKQSFYGGVTNNATLNTSATDGVYKEKSNISFKLGLSGELVPVPEPNARVNEVMTNAFFSTLHDGTAKSTGWIPGYAQNFHVWPDWNRDIPYKDDFVAGSSCFLSTMSAPPTASFGASTRWTSPAASSHDGYVNTSGALISSNAWSHQKFEGSNPEYNALVSQVSSMTLNRYDGSTTGHDSTRGIYNDGVQTAGISAVELPLRLEPYVRGSHRRVKYAVFDPAIGNGVWYSVGVGPTSKVIVDNQYGKMWEAASYPGYVYTFSGARDYSTSGFPLTGNRKLDTHQLKLSFIYTWDRY